MSIPESTELPRFEESFGQRVWRWLFRVVFLAGLVAGGTYAWRSYKQANVPVRPRSVNVHRGTLVQNTTATGRLVPREELYVRPLVSGLLVELRVRAGERVVRGAHLATVRIVADPVALGDAQGQVRMAEVRLARARRELARAETLGQRQLASAQDLATAQDDERLARETLASAQSRARLIAEGTARTGSGRSTRVLAPIDGTVLAVPVTVGDYVSETGAFRDGTTIATLANMDDLLFKGQIEEAYVGQLRIGMPVRVRVGALPGRTLDGTLRWVSPRASVEGAQGVSVGAGGIVPVLTASTVGVTRFELWASLSGSTEGIRAGYSASAELELARRDNALLLEEGVLRFEGERATVRRCVDGPSAREFPVRVGLSDGVKIELLEGLRDGECVLERTP